jgi:lauroyl/myristoyl acyltransferase
MGQRFLFSIVAPLAARLPEAALVGIAVLAGLAAYLFGPGPRRAVHRNLDVVVPDAPPRQRRRLALAAFIHGALGYVELFKIHRYPVERVRRQYSSNDWALLEEALARGKGVIVATAHMGCPSAAGQAVALHGPTSMIVEDLQPPELFERVAAIRGRFGAKLIPADRGSVRTVLTALRANEVVGIMCDRDITGSGELVPFFGKPARLSHAAASFALRTGAAIVPAVGYRTRPFHGMVRMDPPFTLDRTGDTAADVQRGTARILEHLETMIRAAPQQWATFTDVWEER